MTLLTTERPDVATEHLVERSRLGDQTAFSALVEAHQAAVFGTVLRLVRNREVAAEVSNRAFFKAYEHLDTFDASRPLRAWLVRIAANEALNELRGQRRDAEHTVSGEAAEIEFEHASGGPDPADVVRRQERSDTIRAAINRLPEPQRVVVVLRYFADLSYGDIAETMQQTVNNVGVLLLRARDRLRVVGITLIGLPLSIAMMAMYVLAVLLAWPLVGLVIGTYVGRMVHRDEPMHVLFALALGLIVVHLAIHLPVVGGLLGFLALTYGLGLVAQSLRGWQRASARPIEPSPVAVAA